MLRRNMSRNGSEQICMADTATQKISPKHEIRRAQIIACAEGEFEKHGFHGAGMSAIAKACGMSVGHLYHYFSSKEELIQAVVQAELDRQACRLDELESLPPEMLASDAARKVETILMHNDNPYRTVLNFEMLAEAQRNPKIAQMLQVNDKLMRDRFCALLISAGVDEPEDRTELLLAFFSGLPARALRHPEQERQSLVDVLVPVVEKIFGEPFRKTET
jgi:AcrR family transcriptional regulator